MSTVRYVSTRGRAAPATFNDVLQGGRAPDGGLWMPDAWPQLQPEDIAACASRPLAATAADLVIRFAGGLLDPEAVAEATREAAAAFIYPGVDPLRELHPNLWLHDLTQGPTASAADFEMQVLARLLAMAADQDRRTRTVLLATAGDDGGAAVAAFAGRPQLRLVVLFPRAAVSSRRLAQIAGTAAPNVRAVAVEGDYEACRGIVDGLMADAGLAEALSLASIGAEAIARLPLQIAAWLAAAARLGAPHRQVCAAAPAGEASLAVAAYAAGRMGLNPSRIIVGANAHGGLADMFATGRFSPSAASTTATPELDVACPLALERLYFEAVDRNGLETERAMQAVGQAGGFTLAPGARAALAGFDGHTADDVEIARTLVRARNEAGAVIDPATAVVVAAAYRAAADGAAVIAPALAHPALSDAVVERAVGGPVALPIQLRRLDARTPRFDCLPAELEAVRTYLCRISGLEHAA